MGKLFRFILALGLACWLVFLNQASIRDYLDAREVPFDVKLRETFLAMDETLFAAGYNLTEEELTQVWNHTTSRYGDLFHVSPRYEYTTTAGGRILTISPQYTMPPEEYQAALETYKAAITDIVLTADPRWTQVQTALYLHDYIAMHYAYDETTIFNNAYEMVTQGTAVCQGYTQLYGDLLTACGIPNTYIISEEMRHTWNVVQLDGSWYHVDVTHDDPISDRLGKVSHTNFLRSDGALPEHSFTPSEGLGMCTDPRYDSGAVWEGISSGFVPLGDVFYFIKDGDLYKWMADDIYYIDTIYATWYTDDTQTSYWEGHYSALWAAGDWLLYSKPDCIMGYHPDTGVYRVLYEHSGPEDIYGMQYINGVLKLQVSRSPNEPGEIITAAIQLP